MKKISSLFFLWIALVLSGSAWAQNDANVALSSTATLTDPLSVNGTGTLVFSYDNTSQNGYSIPAKAFRLLISFPSSYGPDGGASAVVASPASNKFDWSYDATNNTLIGVSNTSLAPAGGGQVTVNVKGISSTNGIKASTGIQVQRLKAADLPNNQPNDDSAVAETEVNNSTTTPTTNPALTDADFTIKSGTITNPLTVGGTGTLSFTYDNISIQKDTIHAGSVQVTLKFPAEYLPDGDASAPVASSANIFTWSYNAATRELTGVTNKDLLADGGGQVDVKVKGVTQTSTAVKTDIVATILSTQDVPNDYAGNNSVDPATKVDAATTPTTNPALTDADFTIKSGTITNPLTVGGTGTLSFTYDNISIQKDTIHAGSVQVTLKFPAEYLPDGDASAPVASSANIFTWSYNAATRELTGVTNQDLLADGGGQVDVKVKGVTQTSSAVKTDIVATILSTQDVPNDYAGNNSVDPATKVDAATTTPTTNPALTDADFTIKSGTITNPLTVGGTGTLSFTYDNISIQKDTIHAGSVQVTLKFPTEYLPDGDASAPVASSANIFTWSYNAATRELTGVTNQDLLADGGGQVDVKVKGVTQTNAAVKTDIVATILSTRDVPNDYAGNNSVDPAAKVDGSLPVSLIAFNAHVLNDQSVEVVWKTVREVNNAKYVIERSRDMLSFETVTEVKDVAGTSSAIQNYRIIDANPYKGTSYYRLVQVDIDGKSTTYRPVSVVVDRGDYVVYPNPVTSNYFQVQVDEPENCELFLRTSMGQRLPFERQVKDDHTITITTPNKLTSGVYFLVVQERGSVRTHKVIIQ